MQQNHYFNSYLGIVKISVDYHIHFTKMFILILQLYYLIEMSTTWISRIKVYILILYAFRMIHFNTITQWHTTIDINLVKFDKKKSKRNLYEIWKQSKTCTGRGYTLPERGGGGRGRENNLFFVILLTKFTLETNIYLYLFLWNKFQIKTIQDVTTLEFSTESTKFLYSNLYSNYYKHSETTNCSYHHFLQILSEMTLLFCKTWD